MTTKQMTIEEFSWAVTRMLISDQPDRIQCWFGYGGIRYYMDFFRTENDGLYMVFSVRYPIIHSRAVSIRDEDCEVSVEIFEMVKAILSEYPDIDEESYIEDVEVIENEKAR